MHLSFHGAVEEVTGSCFLVQTKRARVLIDCGMKQGERMCVLKSLEPFSFAPEKLDAVLVTHAHFDHTGRLPELVKAGYTGAIYTTPPTKALTDIILQDSLHIMAENAEKCGDPVPYLLEHKEAALKQMQGIGYHTEFEPAPGIKAMFHDAGHILGSAYVTLEIPGEETLTGKPMRLVFSGDIGNDDVPILGATEPIDRADVVICESTYGNRDHEPTEERGAKLATFAKEVLGGGGTLLIPAFSVERTQELLYELDKLLHAGELPRVPIYLDSPLAIRATELYRHFSHYLTFAHPSVADGDLFSFEGLRETMAKEDSMAINNDHGPKIIIAGNGMMTGGRILHHLRRYLPDPKSGLLIIGFQAPGTLGRKVFDGATSVKIYRQEVEVKAKVKGIGAFSAHGDRSKLTRWLVPQQGQIQKVFLVHGDIPTKEEFAQHLRKHISPEIVIPRLNQVYEF